MGIFKPKVRNKDGTLRETGVWWIDYYSRGRRIRESSGSPKKMVAEALLRQRLGEVAAGKTPGVYLDRVTFQDLADAYLCEHPKPQDQGDPHFEKQLKAYRTAKNLVSHLTDFFKGYRANEIDTAHVWQYRDRRRNENAKDSTVNRECAALRRMFNLGRHCNPPKVDRAPHIPMVKERNVRRGFFEHGEFLALHEALPDYLEGFVTFAYRSGWRKSEIASLTWRQVDRAAGTVTLNVGDTKNEAGRVLYLDAELRDVIERQYRRWKNSGRLIPYVFTDRRARGRIGDIRKAWSNACDTAGIGARLFHDLRRTACRNMVRSGIPERVAMMVSGHKTRSVFDRYNIVSDGDLRAAAEKQAAYLEAAARSNKWSNKTLADQRAEKEASTTPCKAVSYNVRP